MAAPGYSTTVPEGFHYETKYAILSYLSLLTSSRSRSSETAVVLEESQHAQEIERERNNRLKKQIENELKQLEEEITASFSRTGFDRHTSPVFSPANPESSIEDSLAALADRVSWDLDAHLSSATQTLLTSDLSFERFRAAVEELSSHAQAGWSKVLVPLVLLQALLDEGQLLETLLDYGLRYLEESQADFIIQQGGWGTVFSLDETEDPGVIIAEDSNDIYILSGEQASSDQISPPASLLTLGESTSWQPESLPVSLTGHESWAQIGMMDPEDIKSLDSAEGVALVEEQSENNSSNSDIVHVEREDAELLDEGGDEAELQSSVLSMLGSESELAAVREEVPSEPEPEFPAKLSDDPPTSVEKPVHHAAVPEPVLHSQSQPEPVPAPVEPQIASIIKEPVSTMTPAAGEEPEPVAKTIEREVLPTSTSQELPVSESQEQPKSVPEPESSDLPVLLCGALVAIAAILAYGVLAYRKK